jgi:hypothetical protein
VIRAAALLAVAFLTGCAGDSDPPEVSLHLVYTRAVGRIWIGDADGRNMRPLTRGEYGLVSPDGRLVAIARGSATRIVQPDGSDASLGRGRPAGWFGGSRHLLLFRGRGLESVDIEDRDSTAVLIADAGLLRGWSVSPDGRRLAYGLARRESRSGQCGEYTDIYVVDRSGTARRRLTHDGRSSDPVWGDDRIAFAREPVKPACAMPKAGIWTMGTDGTNVRPVLGRAPPRFAWNGYYGLRPHGWVTSGSLLIAGVRSEWGDELALIDLRTKRIRRPDLDPRPVYRRHMYVDHVSRDGRYVLATACGAETPCTISLFSVLEGRARNVVTGRVSAAHWNR